MFTYNVFRKKKCFLEGNNVIIDGDNYIIQNVKETENYKSRMYFVVLVLLIVTPFIMYVSYMGLKEDIINNHDFTDKTIKSVILLFVLSSITVLWWVVIKFGFIDCSNCRSFWLVNGKGLYIEKNDDFNIEAKLREVKQTIEHSQNKLNDTTRKKSKMNIVEQITSISWIAVAAFFYGLLYLGLKGYIKEDLFIPLLLFFVAIIFLLRFYQLKEELNNLRWKK